MDKKKIERINELAHKKKTIGLSEEELREQENLRQEYLSEFRASFGNVLKNTVIEYPDGSRTPLQDLKSRKKS